VTDVQLESSNPVIKYSGRITTKEETITEVTTKEAAAPIKSIKGIEALTGPRPVIGTTTIKGIEALIKRKKGIEVLLLLTTGIRIRIEATKGIEALRHSDKKQATTIRRKGIEALIKEIKERLVTDVR